MTKIYPASNIYKEYAFNVWLFKVEIVSYVFKVYISLAKNIYNKKEYSYRSFNHLSEKESISMIFIQNYTISAYSKKNCDAKLN